MPHIFQELSQYLGNFLGNSSGLAFPIFIQESCMSYISQNLLKAAFTGNIRNPYCMGGEFTMIYGSYFPKQINPCLIC